ncbi:hypothetical protein BDA96_03G423400 [Sorghum bicolor]|uniref:Uncharacterized protein n=2 Tax=Sorghum bicolor TaxID=4558 RepID=A0A921RIU5_SORBI|nr:hypothetical protein BDA96_03G423400 [Sorghum bicolor]KXG33934.1 hypothetical protein SORBI_3003G392500 [Sorghum bicolor]
MHVWIATNLRRARGTYQTCCISPWPAGWRTGRPGWAGHLDLDVRPARGTWSTSSSRHASTTIQPQGPPSGTASSWTCSGLGDGIFNSDGETWVAALEFTTCTLRTARHVPRSIDLQDLLLRLTLDNICGLAFGKDPETLARGLPENAFASAFDRATETTLNRFIFPECVWRCKKWLGLGMETTLACSVQHVDRYLSAVIIQVRPGPPLAQEAKAKEAAAPLLAAAPTHLVAIAVDVAVAGAADPPPSRRFGHSNGNPPQPTSLCLALGFRFS